MTRVAVRSPDLLLHAAVHRRSIDDGFTVVPLAPSDAPPSGVDALVETQDDLDALQARGDGRVRALLRTSGTTGEPTWVPITRAMLEAHRAAANARLRSGPGTVWLAVLPAHHIGGVALLDRCLHDGAELRPMDRFTVEGVRDALPGSTHISLVPTMLRRLLDAGVRPPASLRCALVGGDRLDPDLSVRALDAGWPLFATYGLTEACSQVATATPDEVRADPASVGRPLDGVTVRILDDGWGRIEVSGPTVAGGRVVTGDIGRLDAEGRLSVRGRVVERIVTGGETVDARAIEAVLRTHRLIRDACVVGVPDAEWGQRVEAMVEAVDATVVVDQNAMADQVQAWAKQNLPPHEAPKRIVVNALPRTDTGKLRRGAVLEALQASGTVPT